jgi:hypothetical protein
MTEMVDRELRLPAVRADAGQFVGHHRRVVDKHVDAPVRGEEIAGEALNAAEVRQVKLGDLHARHPADDLAGLIGVAGGHHDGSAGIAEPAGHRGADAGVAAGHDGELAREVDALQEGCHTR